MCSGRRKSKPTLAGFRHRVLSGRAGVLLLGEPVFSNMADRSGSPASTPAEGGYVPDDPDATIHKNDHELMYRPLEVNGRLVQGQLVCTRCRRVRTTLRWFAEHDCRSADGMQHTLSTFE